MPISKRIRDLIANAWPDFFPCLVGTIGPNGPQISPKSSVRVFDDEHLAWWERSKRQALANVQYDDRVTVYFANFAEMKAGKARGPQLFRFYGRARLIEKGDPLWQRIFDNMNSEFEWNHVGADEAFGVLMKIERVENVIGKPVDTSV
jgi:hypothetical protein